MLHHYADVILRLRQQQATRFLPVTISFAHYRWVFVKDQVAQFIIGPPKLIQENEHDFPHDFRSDLLRFTV